MIKNMIFLIKNFKWVPGTQWWLLLLWVCGWALGNFNHTSQTEFWLLSPALKILPRIKAAVGLFWEESSFSGI